MERLVGETLGERPTGGGGHDVPSLWCVSPGNVVPPGGNALTYTTYSTMIRGIDLGL